MNFDLPECEAFLQPWFEAVERGDSAPVLELIESGTDVNSTIHVNTTALMLAVLRGHIELVRLLIERGADLTIESMGRTALTHAIERVKFSLIPDPEALEILLAAGARYSLLDAVILNNADIGRIRLDEGANVNTGRGGWDGPVLKTAAELGHLGIIDLLLDRGADIEATNDLGDTPLMGAAGSGQSEAVRSLLDRGAEIDAVDWTGTSALANAAIADHHETVQLLLSRGARRGIVDSLALDDLTIFEALLDLEIRSDNHVDSISDGSRRLAILAAGRGNVRILRLLLDRGAVHTHPWNNGHSLLAEAARYGHIDAVRFLLDRGADLHAVSTDKMTPLDWAIREGRDEVARVLRGAGAER